MRIEIRLKKKIKCHKGFFCFAFNNGFYVLNAANWDNNFNNPYKSMQKNSTPRQGFCIKVHPSTL
jgi:hypothetical protein